MKKILLLVVVVTALAIPATGAAFHHASIPASVCANANAGSPSNDNGNAKGQLINRNPNFNPPLPPFGTPGAFMGAGDEHCAAAGN